MIDPDDPMFLAPGGLAGMRDLLRGTQGLRRYQPSRDGARGWDAAARRLA